MPSDVPRRRLGRLLRAAFASGCTGCVAALDFSLSATARTSLGHYMTIHAHNPTCAARAHKCKMMHKPTTTSLRCPATHHTRCEFDPVVGSKQFLRVRATGRRSWPRASTTLRWCSKDDGTIAATVVVYRAAIAALWSVGVSRRPQASKTRGKQLNRPGTVPRLDILVGPRSTPRKFALWGE